MLLNDLCTRSTSLDVGQMTVVCGLKSKCRWMTVVYGLKVYTFGNDSFYVCGLNIWLASMYPPPSLLSPSIGVVDLADLQQLRRDQGVGVQEVRQAKLVPAVMPWRGRAVQAGSVLVHDSAAQPVSGRTGRPTRPGTHTLQRRYGNCTSAAPAPSALGSNVAFFCVAR